MEIRGESLLRRGQQTPVATGPTSTGSREPSPLTHSATNCSKLGELTACAPRPAGPCKERDERHGLWLKKLHKEKKGARQHDDEMENGPN